MPSVRVHDECDFRIHSILSDAVILDDRLNFRNIDMLDVLDRLGRMLDRIFSCRLKCLTFSKNFDYFRYRHNGTSRQFLILLHCKCAGEASRLQ